MPSALQTFTRSSQISPSHFCSFLSLLYAVFDKFMNDLADSWHGLYKKHLPTGATGPHFGLLKKGRLPLAFKNAFGVTGAFTGPKHVVDELVDEKIDAAASVKDFFQDVRKIILLNSSIIFINPLYPLNVFSRKLSVC